jgi:hypothetical protein
MDIAGTQAARRVRSGPRAPKRESNGASKRNRQFDLARSAYGMCLVWAWNLIAIRKEPHWFQEHREVVRDVAKDIGVITQSDIDALMSIVLACDLAEEYLEEPGILQPKEICRKSDQLRSHLIKAHSLVIVLRRASRPEALKAEFSSAEYHLDGSVTLKELRRDAYEGLDECILEFLARSEGVAPSKGQPPGVMGYAVKKLEWFFEHHSPNLSVENREDLMARLLVLLCHKLRRARPFVFAPQQGQRDRMATSFAMSRRRRVEIELGT